VIMGAGSLLAIVALALLKVKRSEAG
jgi:hypothetical protein